MSNAAILLGGGNSTRMGDAIEDKIIALILNKPVFAYSIEAFINTKIIDTLVIVYRNSSQKEFIEEWLMNNVSTDIKILWSQGGKKRQDSVFSGLKILSNTTQYVFIHDMARPLIQSNMIKELYKVLLTKSSATLAHRVVDTIKQVLPEYPQKLHNIDRSNLWAMETPQAFSYPIALEALKKTEAQELEFTDDTGAVNMLGIPIEIVENKLPNPKITVKNDLDYITFLLGFSEKNNYVTI